MVNEKWLIDATPLMKSGWHLVKTGESNKFLASMSLADVPAVDAMEVVHGHWYKAPHHPYRCSCCGEMALLDMYGESHCRSNYCPNCGAKMDGGADNA